MQRLNPRYYKVHPLAINIAELDDVVLEVKSAYPKSNTILFDTLALVGEAGELANIVKKIEYYSILPDTPGRMEEQVIDEMCDILFHLVALCHHIKLPFQELVDLAANKHIERLEQRSSIL